MQRPASPLIAPSILSADHAHLAEEIRAVETAGADWLHVDVMDGHFVPNLTLGPPIIKSLRKVSKLPFDVHLMIEAPERSIPSYVDAGANHVIVHVETCPHLHRTLAQIRELGAKPGVTLNPATPVDMIVEVLGMVDVVLVMSVNPGFGGQRFIPESLGRIARLAELRRQHGYAWQLAVDGGVGADTVGDITRAGATALIAGSAIFSQGKTPRDYRDAIGTLRERAMTGLR